MNERLKELARQAKPNPNLIWEDADLDRFAELVRADEREACAMLYESLFDAEDNSCNEAEQCAATIRARGNHG